MDPLVRLFSVRVLACGALCAALAGAACGGSDTTKDSASAATGGPVTNPVDPNTVSAIVGTISLQGTPPPNPTINMGSDPYCMKLGAATTPPFVVSDGGLENVFVYVKDGLGTLKFPVPSTPVVLDQKGCSYSPRVFGIQVGQSLDIVNSDDTLHNVHAMPKANREFNRGQGLKGIKSTTTFTTPEVMLPFKCDVHKWMNAWVGVLEHPFYAISGKGGTFALAGLPPGTYTIEAWHEKLGTQTQMVTIGAKESKTITFAFKV
jgi:plastocyanin